MSFTADSPLVNEVIAGVHFEPRRGHATDILLLHYTGLPTLARSIEALTRAESRVSCHYLIAEDGAIIQMIPEAWRAWHAGLASWQGETDINSRSIGIELQNPGHSGGLPPFPAVQIAAAIALSRDIVRRHAIAPERVLAHSDVAPLRKIDPGELFPWARLTTAGVGVWVRPEPVAPDDPGLGPGVGGPLVAETQRALARWGYWVPLSGEMDASTSLVVAAFQRRHRPARIDGRLDRSTTATLERLLSLGAASCSLRRRMS